MHFAFNKTREQESRENTGHMVFTMPAWNTSNLWFMTCLWLLWAAAAMPFTTREAGRAQSFLQRPGSRSSCTFFKYPFPFPFFLAPSLLPLFLPPLHVFFPPSLPLLSLFFMPPSFTIHREHYYPFPSVVTRNKITN